MTDAEAETLLLTAMSSAFGLEVPCNAPLQLQQRLYRVRQRVARRDLFSLSLRATRTSVIIRRRHDGQLGRKSKAPEEKIALKAFGVSL